MASTAYFNGKLMVWPQVQSRLDTSRLPKSGLLASGIVGIVGEASNGEPGVVHSITSYSQAKDTFGSGDLLDGIGILFSPSSSIEVQGGAQAVLAVKTNPSTQATLNLKNGSGVDVITATSVDWGVTANTNKIKVEAGTLTGKKITLEKLGKDSEIYDNVGGTNAEGFKIDSTGDYTTCTLAINGTATTIAAAVTIAGKDDTTSCNFSAFTSGKKLSIVSDAVGDTTQTCTAYGYNGATYQSETLSLAGTTPVVGTLTWTEIYGVTFSAACAGTITGTDTNGAPVTVFTSALGISVGVHEPWVSPNLGMPIEGILTIKAGGASTRKVLIIGKNANGVTTQEALTLNGPADVPSSTTWSRIDLIGLGKVITATNVTFSCNAISAAHATYRTINQLKYHIDSWGGFTTTALVANPDVFDPADMDYITATAITSETTFYYNIHAAVTAVNDGSGFQTWERITSAITNHGTLATVSPSSPLTGGVAGATSNTDWDDAINEFLKEENYINIFVPCISEDYGAVTASTVFDYVKTFARACEGKCECQTWVGLKDDAKATIKANIAVFNNRMVSCVSQPVKRIDSQGVMKWFQPWAYACVEAGKQAGMRVGEPNTNKYNDVLDFDQDSSWNPGDDKAEMIQMGLCFMQKDPVAGFKTVRAVTSYTQDANPFYCESSTSFAISYMIRNVRNAVKQMLGKAAIEGIEGQIKSVATGKLEEMEANQILVGGIDPQTGNRVRGFGNVQVTYSNNLRQVTFAARPVGVVNFIGITCNLEELEQSA